MNLLECCVTLGVSPASGVGQVFVLEPVVFQMRDYFFGCRHCSRDLYIFLWEIKVLTSNDMVYLIHTS